MTGPPIPPGGVPGDDLDRLLEELSVEERLETARRKEQAALVGLAVVALPPVAFLIQAFVYWGGRPWPTGGGFALVLMLVFPVLAGFYWRRARKEREELERKARWLERRRESGA